jgi:nucleoside-diphosphate-sugar epimerase
VAANLLAMEAPDASGEVFNIGCGAGYSLNELVAILNRLLDCELEPVHTAARPGDVARSWADISRAREVLGYAPTVDLEQGLRRTLASFEASPIVTSS